MDYESLALPIIGQRSLAFPGKSSRPLEQHDASGSDQMVRRVAAERRSTEAQINDFLREAGTGSPVEEFLRQHGVSEASCHAVAQRVRRLRVTERHAAGQTHGSSPHCDV